MPMRYRLPKFFTRFWFYSLLLSIVFLFIWAMSRRITRPAKPSTLPIQAALATKISAINMTDVDLSDAIGFVQDLTDVPIEVDWKALGSVRIERNTRITRHLTTLRAGEVLDSFCSVIPRYQITTNGSRIRVSVQGAPWRDLTHQRSFDPNSLDSIELYELTHKAKPPPPLPLWEKLLGSRRYTLVIDRGALRLWITPPDPVAIYQQEPSVGNATDPWGIELFEFAGLSIRRSGSPFHTQIIAVPFWLFAALAAIPSLLALRRKLHERRCGNLARCPGCGYDLRATPDRCPECGRENPAAASGPTASPV